MSMNPSSSAGPSFLGTLALVFLAMAVLFVIDSFLARMEQNETRVQAARLHSEGRRLEQQGHETEAVESYRSALAISRGNPDYKLALARALLAAGELGDAESLLNELLVRDSNDGEANLMMARTLVRQGKLSEAPAFYHRAIYGRWNAEAPKKRTEARLELVGFLAKRGAKAELLAELLRLQDETSGDVNENKRIASLFLVAGSPSRAEEIFRGIIRRLPQDADSRAGLGEAEFARGNYRAAQAQFQIASRLSPEDDKLRHRLQVCDDVLSLDPMRRGLSSAERYRRSLRLLGLTRDSLSQCMKANPPQEFRELMERALQAPQQRVKPKRENEAIEANLDLAEQLWNARKRECKLPAAASEEPVPLVLAKLAQ